MLATFIVTTHSSTIQPTSFRQRSSCVRHNPHYAKPFPLSVIRSSFWITTPLRKQPACSSPVRCEIVHPPSAIHRLVELPTGAVLEVIAELSSHSAKNPHRVSTNHNSTSSNPTFSSDLSQNAKPALLFVHGSKHAAWAFQFLQPYFSHRGWDTYAVSLRYAGRSAALDDIDRASTHASTADPDLQSVPVVNTSRKKKVPVDQLISDLQSLLDTYDGLRGRRIIVLAHSLGGYIVQKWLLDRIAAQSLATQSLASEAESASPRASIIGQVLLASCPPDGNGRLVWRVLLTRGIRTAWAITRAFATDALAKDIQLCRNVLFDAKNVHSGSLSPQHESTVVSDDALQVYMRYFANNRLQVDVRGIKPLSKHNNLDQEPTSASTRTLPTLVVSGSEDVLVDKQAVEETAAFWDGQPVIVDGAPHNLMLYAGWTQVADIVNDWLEHKFGC